MANIRNWNFSTTDGMPVAISLRKNSWLSVNGSQEVKIKTIKNSADSNYFESVFDVALPNGEIAQLFSSTTQKHLVYNGRDVVTGEECTVASIPAWAWVFVVLYAINFFAVLGGALGGVVNIFAIIFTIQIATRSKKSTGVKILLNVLLFIGVVILSLLIASLFLGIRG